MKKLTTADRLKQLMHDRNIKQIDIINLCTPISEQNGIKITKSDLSQYVSGKTSPGNDKLYVLSQALNVEPLWLMGYDDSSLNELTEVEKTLILDFRHLSSTNQDQIIQMMAFLLQQQKNADG